VLTEIGPVEIEVPRDLDASFQPKIVKKRQRRLTGVDQIVLSLSAPARCGPCRSHPEQRPAGSDSHNPTPP
jgi:hypothetical protein